MRGDYGIPSTDEIDTKNVVEFCAAVVDCGFPDVRAHRMDEYITAREEACGIGNGSFDLYALAEVSRNIQVPWIIKGSIPPDYAGAVTRIEKCIRNGPPNSTRTTSHNNLHCYAFLPRSEHRQNSTRMRCPSG
jgi:hypothetical protein